MALVKKADYTIYDIYSLPDEQHAELIDGQLYMMAPPSPRHQEISFYISRKVADFIEKKGGNCKIYPAPFAVFLEKNDTTYVEPDISVICDKEKIDEHGCHGAPDWITEVVSPGSQKMDYYIKLFKYRTAGVKEYWIVDPRYKQVTVYDFANNDVGKYPFDDPIPSQIYEGFMIDLSDFS